MIRTLSLALLIPAALLCVGCNTSLWASQSALAVVSQDDTSLRLQGDFNSAYYVFDSTESITVVLIEGPEDNPTQAAAIRMMWQPKAGLTPVNPDATNATIQYIVFANRRTEEGFYREVGVYSGAGFLHLDSTPGDARLNASLWQADLLLADRSEENLVPRELFDIVAEVIIWAQSARENIRQHDAADNSGIAAPGEDLSRYH